MFGGKSPFISSLSLSSVTLPFY